ncbi:PriCT-2 domain-containing protein [Arsenicibacter rosenii]|uniref:Uncharacterized protein n=1 Tax=Arsenicibacter rosenii TaxID=1750698 RepID=A0A1S2VGZ2_9BACT|nr:BT4734/BF3469 family protein [Arsenicibacter rosenii]OIN58003.1 hypothetical protein BLX24_15815 [Arsenicibacter rosenii]
MATYLPVHDVLNVSVSCFANYDTPANPATISLSKWLTSAKYKSEVEQLRQIDDKSMRDRIKGKLPAITPSGVFTYRQESCMVAGSHTRLIQFDIDPKDNPDIRNYEDLKTQISHLPFVAYCALSASGKGYWGLVPIADIEKHGQHFDALKRVFSYYGIAIDSKPRNVASLRGYSYDPAPYIPEQVMVFELYDAPEAAKPRLLSFSTDSDVEKQRVECCIDELIKRGAYIGDSYGEWYEVGCALANSFGETGREYFHLISQNYPGYQSEQTDRQYTACSKAKSKATLGTFFYLCQRQGIEWRVLVPPIQQVYNQLTILRQFKEDDNHSEINEFKASAYNEDYPVFWDSQPDERTRLVLIPQWPAEMTAQLYKLKTISI